MRSGPVTKATRESAIEACAMMASSCTHDYPLAPASLLADAVDVHDSGAELARAAINAVWPYRASYETVRELWAEAEQLLAHGWNPGDPVEALNVGVSVQPMCRCATEEATPTVTLVGVDPEQVEGMLGQLVGKGDTITTAAGDPPFPGYDYGTGTPTLDDID